MLERIAGHATAWIAEARRAEAAEGARAQLEVHALLQLAIDRAAALLGARGAIYVAEGERLVSRVDSERAPDAVPVPLGAGITGRAAQIRQGQLVNDYPAWAHAMPSHVDTEMRHAIAQPLLVGDLLLGVMVLARYGTDAVAFTEGDLAALGGVAAQAALALRSATLYQEAERRRREAELLAETARTVNASLSAHEVRQGLVEAARELCGADAAGIALWEPGGRAMRLRYRMGLLGLQERAELAAGRASVESTPGGGTTVRAWFPLPTAPPRA